MFSIYSTTQGYYRRRVVAASLVKYVIQDIEFFGSLVGLTCFRGLILSLSSYPIQEGQREVLKH